MACHLLLHLPGNGVLKISNAEEAGQKISLQLDGQVSGKWVELLQRTCEVQLEKGVRITIDLKNVSYADRDGIALSNHA